MTPREWFAPRWARLGELARDLSRPTPVQLLKASPLVVGAVVLLVLVIRNYDTADFPHYDAPDDFVPETPAVTAPPGGRPPLLAVAGTTTIAIPPNTGTARLHGTVRGPAGPVAGATVRLERSILGTVQVLDVLSDAAGAWDAPGMGGGRYRLRAFQPPTLAQPAAEVFLLPDGEDRTFDLVLDAFGDPTVALAAAPAPATVDQQVNVAVLVSGQLVDGDGFVTVRGLPGVFVEVSQPSAWRRETPAGALVTGSDGQVVVTFTCEEAGSVQVSATVRTPPVAATTTTVAPAPGAPPPAPPPPPPPVTGSATFECVAPAASTTAPPPASDSTTSTTTG